MTRLLEHIPVSENLRALFASIGLACYLRLFMRCASLFGNRTVQADSSSELLFAFFIMMFIAVCIAVVVARERIDWLLLESAWGSFITIALVPLSYAVLTLMKVTAAGNDALVACFVLVFAIGMAGAFCAWGCILYELDMHRSFLATVCSLPLYKAFDLIMLLGLRDNHAFGIVISIVMVACWLFCFRPISNKHVREELSLVKDLPLRTIVILLCCVLACSVASGVLSLDDLNSPTPFSFVFAFVLSVLLAASLIVFSRSKRLEDNLNEAMLLVSILLVVIVLFTAIIFSLVDSDSRMPAALIKLTTCFCTICFIIAVTKTMHDRGLSPSYLFALTGILALALPMLCSHFLIPVIDHSTDEFILRYEEAIILVTSGVLIVTAFISLAANNLLKSDGATTVSREEQLETAYQQIANENGLTPREKEVMSLIAQGISMKRIAEVLYISLGTVQTHSKNIYRKLGIHSKQDLYDLVDSHLPEELRKQDYRAGGGEGEDENTGADEGR